MGETSRVASARAGGARTLRAAVPGEGAGGRARRRERGPGAGAAWRGLRGLERCCPEAGRVQPGQESERSAGGARTGSGQGRGFKGKPAGNRGLAEFPGGRELRKEGAQDSRDHRK